MASRSRRVLITGIDGFTGVYLEKLLASAGYDVFGLVYPASRNVKHVVCNITDKKATAQAIGSVQPDYIVHLAGISFVAHSDARQIYDVNYFGSLNILDAVLECGLKPSKIVLASSSNIYGNPRMEIIDESVCPAPISHYAVSKLAMEYMAKNYFDRLNILITRPFNYTGIGQAPQFLIPKIVQHYKEEKSTIALGNLDVVRDFSDVRFVAEVYKRLLECDASAEIVNICSGSGVSLMEIMSMMSAISRREMSFTVDPAFVRQNELKVLIGSNKKLLSLTGNPKVYPIEETLRWMFDAR